MGIGDIFKATKNKALEERVRELEALMTPEQSEVISLSDRKKELEQQIKKSEAEAEKCNAKITSLSHEIEKLTEIIEKKCEELVAVDEEILMQSFGIYTPQYKFSHSDIYKDKLKLIRDEQKFMIKSGTAVLGDVNWTVNGNRKQGQKMVSDMQKLLLRAFNSECDELVEKVKYNNFEASKKRINNSCAAISKLGVIMSIAISDKYRRKKIEELTLAFEYALKKQQEKEEQRQIREQLREEAKLLKEIEEARKRLEKEQTHYMNALAKINLQLSQNPNDAELIAKKQELESKVSDVAKAIREVDYREANKRAGYVYVISNIGAFGEGIYKIGMTRRLDPQERVDELGGASVPFNFDVHAMIFSDDAPKLESTLHKAFEDKKVNMVNQRREFFRVSLDEIKKVIRENYDKTVEFTDIPQAEQFRVSKKMHEPDFYERHESNTAPLPDEPSCAESECKPDTPDTIAEQIKNIISSIPDISCTPEDNSEFIRLHLYTADSRKLGTVKISKSDMSIQYKKIGQDAYIIKTADELKKYIM